MRLIDRLRSGAGEERHSVLTIDDYLGFGGHQYPLGFTSTWQNLTAEAPPDSFESMSAQMFAANPVVFGAVVTRLAVFAQARLQYRRFESGRPQRPFGDRSLAKFEKPWPGGTTLDLLAKMLVRADLGGNAYVWDSGRRLHVWRPDWVTIVLGSRLEPDEPGLAEDVEPVGYLYQPGGRRNMTPRLYLPDEVAHFAPYPDPTANFRGMSWMTPVIRDVMADKAMTEHKWRFLTNAATPNLAIKFDPSQTIEQVRAFKEMMEANHTGVANAYKTLYLGGGADPTVIGADLKQLDFASVAGKGETRIAMAAGVHPVILGASEGMQGSSLNAGNYQQVKRLFGDIRMQHLWRNAVSSLSVIADAPAGAELWFDASDIPFLQEDAKDAAEIESIKATTIRTLVDGGFEPMTVVDAVESQDLMLLVHTGKLSVQLQEAGVAPEPADDGNRDLIEALMHAEERCATEAELDRLRALIDRASQARSLRVVRDDDGMITGVEEVAGAVG